MLPNIFRNLEFVFLDTRMSAFNIAKRGWKLKEDKFGRSRRMKRPYNPGMPPHSEARFFRYIVVTMMMVIMGVICHAGFYLIEMSNTTQRRMKTN